MDACHASEPAPRRVDGLRTVRCHLFPDTPAAS
jgi:hypothetical protein